MTSQEFAFPFKRIRVFAFKQISSVFSEEWITLPQFYTIMRDPGKGFIYKYNFTVLEKLTPIIFRITFMFHSVWA